MRKEKKITHCEVLSRLIHIEIRNIAHAQFIYITEIKELMENLGIISFERVCKFTVQNKDSISVNFLTNKMLNNDIFANVMNTIKNMELNQKI